jgi:GDP-4-dehydro-6-deoxy-D-mannose reductase
MENSLKVWITGAGGMMGSHLAEMLLAAGHDVRATYYKPTIDALDLRKFEAVEVDITDWCSVYDSLADFRPDAVYHLAAQSYPTVSWERPVETLTTNVVGTTIVFEALRRVRADTRIIVAGSSAEYGIVDPSEVPIKERRELRPLHPYGVSKVATDLLATQYHKSYGMHTIVARIFNCTGPRKVGDALSDFVRRCAWLENHPETNSLRVGNLTTKRTIVDVRDLIRALILMMERSEAGEDYNLGGSIAYEMGDILNQVISECKRDDIVPEVDPTLLRPTDEKIIYGDCHKLEAATGWQPEIPLSQTIADMFDYWRSKPDDALLS